ncbi:MAG TPA: AraC family transcriptional regulator [Saprospiraceae bacterium]|nr:AraC family transcriptional regulator [Saprospiraceae bacterium]HQW56605.1 AraC family transcriptional regulator [Saprospiraceae bacterium]
MILYIKNMVCNRCILVLEQVLVSLGLQFNRISMGEVELKKQPSTSQMLQLNLRLIQLGFEILDDQKQKDIEKIKGSLIEKAQSGEVEVHFSITEFLNDALHREYRSISRLFSEVEGMTIEQFFILQKIEKVKELLIYGEQNLSEISYLFGYSSVAHLSAQFKKVTGLTPTQFKKIGGRKRISLDKVQQEKL